MGRLDGKVVVVTGANSGVGEAACKLFAKEGAKVVLAARRVDKLENVKNEIEKEGGIAHAGDMLPPLIEVGASRSRILPNPVSTS